MSILLATLCLNEMQWLPKLVQQHLDWKDMVKWVFIEAADKVYAETNPEMVTEKGLSVDGTTDFLKGLAQTDDRVIHIPFGFSSHKDPAQCKVEARQVYMDIAAAYQPEFVFICDADEFYTTYHQASILRLMRKMKAIQGFTFKQRHIWRPQSLGAGPLFEYEVVGGYWDVPHARGWRWQKGMHYRDNHNTPHGVIPVRFDQKEGSPECCHMGFASSAQSRKAKHAYYVARGEGKEVDRDMAKRRRMYCECRAAFETYKMGDTLPHGARVIPYCGQIPEIFRGDDPSC